MGIKNQKFGFTIIELLIAISIVITCATIVMAIITATFRSSNSTYSQERLRQAGDGALTKISTMIKYADKFNGAYVGDSPQNYTKLTQCVTEASGDDPSVDAIKITSAGVDRTIACDNDLKLDGNSLFDPNSVVVSSCTLSCTQNTSSDQPLITISVDLATPSNTQNGGLQENTSSISLSQTVRMTNITQ